MTIQKAGVGAAEAAPFQNDPHVQFLSSL